MFLDLGRPKDIIVSLAQSFSQMMVLAGSCPLERLTIQANFQGTNFSRG